MGQQPPHIVEGQRVLLELQDPIGHTVLLFAPRWEAKIIPTRTDVTLEDVRETITDPDFVYEFKGDRRYYRRKNNRLLFLGIVRDYRGYDSIVTFFITDKIKDWPEARIAYVRPKPRPI